MGTIKNWFKKILPPPVNSFMREVNRIVTLEEKNQALMQQLLQRVERQEQQLKIQEEQLKMQEQLLNLQENQFEEMCKVSKIQNDILSSLQGKIYDQGNLLFQQNENILGYVRKTEEKLLEPILYKNDFERNIIKHSFALKEEYENFETDFQE